MVGRWRKSGKGTSLTEVLITLALVGVMMMANYTLMAKAKINAASFTGLNRAVMESEILFENLRKNVNSATRLGTDSYSKRLTLYVMKPDFTYKTVIYRISTVSGKDILERSDNGGTTWLPAYSISSANSYRVTGEFLYCGPANNCTRFTDTNGNGIYQPGIDAAGTLAAGFTGTPLTDPSKANKILLYGFTFDRDVGNPAVKKGWPNTYLRLKKMTVWSSPLPVQSFSTNAAGSTFNAAFRVHELEWDARERRLLLAGNGVSDFYQTSRDGVGIKPVYSPGIAGSEFDGIAFDNINGGRAAYLLDASAKKIYRYNMDSQMVETTIDISAYMDDPRSIIWDSAAPDEIYLVGHVIGAPGTGMRILKRNKWNGAAGGGTNSWALPAGLTDPGGVAMDPSTGFFYVVQNTVSGAGASRTIDIYKIDPASPTTTDKITINIADLGSSAVSGGSNCFGLAYEIETNRLFISDFASNKVYEVIPNRMLTTND